MWQNRNKIEIKNTNDLSKQKLGKMNTKKTYRWSALNFQWKIKIARNLDTKKKTLGKRRNTTRLKKKKKRDREKERGQEGKKQD